MIDYGRFLHWAILTIVYGVGDPGGFLDEAVLVEFVIVRLL